MSRAESTMTDEPGTTTTTTTLSKLPQVASTSTPAMAPATSNTGGSSTTTGGYKPGSAADSYKKALHQAILLKANSNNSMDTLPGLSSSLFNLPPVPLTSSQSSMPSAAKWTNVNNLVTISNSSSGFNLSTTTTASKTSQQNTPATTTAADTELDNTDLLGLATNELFSQLHDELSMACGTENNTQSTDSDGEELDTPLNIKENINLSLRNLNQTLDPMRSSDDEETNAQMTPKSQDVIVIGSLLPNVSNNQVVKLAIPLNNNSKSSNGYVTKVASSTNINIPVKLPAQPIKSINLSSVSLLSANSLSNLTCNNSQTRLAKRVKDEALSNSSSSDEESESHNQQLNQSEQQPLAQRQKLCQTGLQNSQNDNNKLQQNNMTTYKGSSRLNVNHVVQQPKITPVVSQAERGRLANTNNNNQESAVANGMICPSPNYLNQSMESSTSDLTNTSYSSSSLSKSTCSSSQKSSQSSLDSPDMSFSCVASPTSCCSSSSANNDSAIDLHDDNSSTASGPIYIRQPGFEHHAHEVIEASSHPQLTFTSIPAVAVINANNYNKSVNVKPVKVKKINEKSISYLTSNYSNLNALSATSTTTTAGSNNNIKVSKAKKKLCMMISDTVQDLNTQLKPISNKAKREPLPMRLRALPPSFWQQPNLQPNVTPSSMYLPPLFKHMDLDCTTQMDNNTNMDNNVPTENTTNNIILNRTSSDSNLNAREVRISPANTDLLFKLFDQVDSPSNQTGGNNNARLANGKLGRLNILHIKSNQSQQPVKTNNQCKNLIKGEDPCIVDSVTEGLFPLLRLDGFKEAQRVNSMNCTLTTNAMDCLSSNGLSNSSPVISSYSSNGSHHLPMLQFEQNYSQALSDVVAAL